MCCDTNFRACSTATNPWYCVEAARFLDHMGNLLLKMAPDVLKISGFHLQNLQDERTLHFEIDQINFFCTV